MILRILAMVLFGVTGGLSAAREADSGFSKVYAEAIATEARAFEDFREARAVDAAFALKIPLEMAKERINVPGPDRKALDVSILAQDRLRASETARYRETIRAVQAELDDMIAATRRLLEQLRDEESALEQGADITLETLRSEMMAAMEATALAAEDDAARAKDVVGGADSRPLAPSAEARNDALIAARAAAQAARSAARAQARADAAPEESDERPQLETAAETATKAAAHSATAAREAARAHTAASAAARAHDRETEIREAEQASRAAAEAVYQALLAAIAAGEIDQAVLAQMSGQGTDTDGGQAEFGNGLSGSWGEGSETGAGLQGRESTGRTARHSLLSPDTGTAAPSNPGPTTPSRGISAIGDVGTGWIRLDTWYIVGPFPNPGRQNVDVSFPPETLVDLDAIYQGDGGRPVRWTFVQSSGEMVRPLEDPPYVIYYAYTEVFSDADRELWVAVGSDDNSRIWLNDQLIWKSGYGLKIWRRNEGFRRVLFRRGINRILYRVENGHGASGFSFLIQTAPMVAD